MTSRPSAARRTAGYSTATAVLGLASTAMLLLDQALSIVVALTTLVVGTLALHGGAVRSRRTTVLTVGGLGLATICAAVWITWLLGAD